MDRGGFRLHVNHTGHPSKSLLGDSRALAVMAIMYDGKIRHESFLQRLFHHNTPLQHQAITGSLHSEEIVDDSTSSTSLDCI